MAVLVQYGECSFAPKTVVCPRGNWWGVSYQHASETISFTILSGFDDYWHNLTGLNWESSRGRKENEAYRSVGLMIMRQKISENSEKYR